jgi:hypothetical protein
MAISTLLHQFELATVEGRRFDLPGIKAAMIEEMRDTAKEARRVALREVYDDLSMRALDTRTRPSPIGGGLESNVAVREAMMAIRDTYEKEGLSWTPDDGT